MKKIPDDMCFEGFYIWFNSDKKEEYILTPNFLLGEIENVDKEDFLKLKLISRMTTNSIANYKLKKQERKRMLEQKVLEIVTKYQLIESGDKLVLGVSRRTRFYCYVRCATKIKRTTSF